MTIGRKEGEMTMGGGRGEMTMGRREKGDDNGQQEGKKGGAARLTIVAQWLKHGVCRTMIQDREMRTSARSRKRSRHQFRSKGVKHI